MAIDLTLLPHVSYAGQEISGPRLHALLALLATDLRTGCGTARLVEGLWPDEQPENPAKALQILVSRIRSHCGPDLIERTTTGYRLTLAEDQIDTSAALLSVSAGAQHARTGDHATALVHAEAGLALWKDAEDADPGLSDPLSVLRTERAATRRALVRARALALSRLNRAAEAFEPLAEVVRERPRDEEALLELLRSEAATAGPSAAIARYDAYRRILRSELGTDPGSALKAGYQQLLKGEKPTVRHGVAHEPNPLLGRDDDIAAVTELLGTSRVTSIIGPGGLGKTRLANTVARSARHRVVHFVALAAVTEDDDVVTEVASALGASDTARTAPAVVTSGQSAETAAAAATAAAPRARAVAGIVDALGSGPVLLILDNCEQVICGAAELVRALVAMTRDLRVLTTSRTPLGLSSESVYLLPELALNTTVELFTQRATAARPGVDLPADAVLELCRHLDGLPLAVELAAARVRVLSVPEIGRRLGDRFALLRGGARDAPERHQTLQAVVDWSWNLLDPAGRDAMRALSIFPGGFTADAALHLIPDETVLEQLVDQSLLKAIETPHGLRFRMLETVREFSAAERDTDRAMTGFLAWAKGFGASQWSSILDPDPSGLEHVQVEQDNLLQALRVGLDTGDGAVVAATSAALVCLWTLEAGYGRTASITDEIAWLFSHYRPEPALVEATRTAVTLCVMNTLAVQGPGVGRLLLTLRKLPAAPPDTFIRALAQILIITDPSEIFQLCDRTASEPLLAGVANGFASYMLEQQGDVEAALSAAEAMRAAFEHQAPPAWIMVSTHGRIGELSLHLERSEQARHHMRAAVEALGPWPDVIGIRWALVAADLQFGDIDEAEYWLEQAGLHDQDDSFGQSAYRLGVRAEILLARGEIETGLRMWRRAADPSLSMEYAIFQSDPPGLETWTLETQSAAVVAHARFDRLDLVEDIVAELPRKLVAVLSDPVIERPGYQVYFPACGAVLLAIGVTAIGRGDASSGVRLVALAERFGFLKMFQPTLASSRLRAVAEQADRPAYEDAVSSYAGLDRDALRALALSLLTPDSRLP